MNTKLMYAAATAARVDVEGCAFHEWLFGSPAKAIAAFAACDFLTLATHSLWDDMTVEDVREAVHAAYC